MGSGERSRKSTDSGRPHRSRTRSRSHHKKDRKRGNITEEDIAEYQLVKKALRKAEKVAKKLKAENAPIFGYANDSNPFGDTNLNERFVWRKKKLDITQGVPLDAYSFKSEKKRQREKIAEIEKVKKRTEERAFQKALLATERYPYRDRAVLQDWEKEEDEFDFEQSKLRSQIRRLREGRINPIDILTKHLDTSEDMEIELNEPYTVLIQEEAGSYSPELFHGDDNEEAIDHREEDRAIVERKRMAVLEERRLEKMASKPSTCDGNIENKALIVMVEEGDAVFGTNLHSQSQVYRWHDDKYGRTRKPKYFNRVHTGYEWRNKYNQTHYDHDNPPPKAVQGYKFNIFYPDLVDDKSVTPSYTIENDGDSAETCIIRFHAGPPYEDIAFRIVNKDWDKKGHKSTFERGILRLYINFKRYHYRR